MDSRLLIDISQKKIVHTQKSLMHCGNNNICQCSSTIELTNFNIYNYVSTNVEISPNAAGRLSQFVIVQTPF